MLFSTTLHSFRQYRRSYLPNDLTAALSVFLAGLPLCLGIALASGAPLFGGLVAGIIGGIIVGFLSGSEISVSGPAAGLAVIVTESISSLGSYEVFLVAVILAGIMQVVMGFLKAGRLSSFFPDSVIKGMLVGIGLVIVLKQIPHALGRDSDYEGEFEFSQLADHENTFTEIYQALLTASPGALIISLVSIGFLLVWDRLAGQGRKLFRLLPAAMLMVLIGVSLNQFFRHYLPDFYLGDSNEHMVRLPVLSAQNGWSSILDFPDFSILTDLRVYGIAATIAAVASLETLINLEASDRLDPLNRVSSPSQELVAQGIGNILSGLAGGLPVTSVVVRTSTNVFSGSQSRLSTILQGGLLLLAVLLAGSVLNHIPLACIAALLIVVGYKLAGPAVFSAIYREGRSQFVPFIVTVLSIIFIDLLFGLLIGLAVGYLFVLYTNSQSPFRVIRDGHNVLVKFQKDVYFLSKPALKELLRSLKPGDSVLIDGRHAGFIDHDIYTLLTDYAKTAQRQGINYELREVTQRKKNAPTYAAV